MSLTPVHAQLLQVWSTCRTSGPLSVSVVKQHSQHTIGVEFSSRLVKLGEKRIKLQVPFLVKRFSDFAHNTLCEALGYCRTREVQVSRTTAGRLFPILTSSSQVRHQELLQGRSGCHSSLRHNKVSRHCRCITGHSPHPI